MIFAHMPCIDIPTARMLYHVRWTEHSPYAKWIDTHTIFFSSFGDIMLEVELPVLSGNCVFLPLLLLLLLGLLC